MEAVGVKTAGRGLGAAVACLAGALLALGLVAFLGVHYSGLGKMRLDLPPEVLAQKAHEMIARLGYPERPTDTVFSLDFDNDFKDYVEKNDKPRPDQDAVLS